MIESLPYRASEESKGRMGILKYFLITLWWETKN